jgi:glycine betaine/proline transport system permease protein
VSSTPTALIEAADAFGATPRQKLWKVELPFAAPQIMAGLNQTIMLSLSMVVIAALVGASGSGKTLTIRSILRLLLAARGDEDGRALSDRTGCYYCILGHWFSLLG